MDVLRKVCPGLDEATLAYLAEAVEDGEDASELIGPYCDDLGVTPADRCHLLDVLATTRKDGGRRAAALGAEAIAAPHGGTLRDLLGGPEETAEAAVRSPQPGPPRPRIEQPPEQKLDPPWCEGVVADVPNQPPLPAWARKLFAGAWRQELRAWSRRLSAAQVARLALELSPKAAKVASIIETNDMNGDLCLAGGASILMEKLNGLRRGDLDAAKSVTRQLLKALQEADTDSASYRELLFRPAEVTMLQSFAGTLIEPWLRKVMGPAQPLYVVCDARETKVKAVDAEIQQLWGVDRSEGEEDLRVACVLDGGRVRQNMIYVWQRSGWWLLASVDFAQHGEAGPGHWHLNRTPSGDQVEHWGPRGDVFHGTCWNCPLWWLVVLASVDYLERPARLDLLPRDAFGPTTRG